MAVCVPDTETVAEPECVEEMVPLGDTERLGEPDTLPVGEAVLQVEGVRVSVGLPLTL